MNKFDDLREKVVPIIKPYVKRAVGTLHKLICRRSGGRFKKYWEYKS